MKNVTGFKILPKKDALDSGIVKLIQKWQVIVIRANMNELKCKIKKTKLIILQKASC